MSYVQERLAEIARENAIKGPVAKPIRASKPKQPPKPAPLIKGKAGYVYFISRGFDRVKIGFAADVFKRLHDLQTGCPDDLHIVSFVPTYEVCEGMFHHRFRDVRIRGEWFEMSDEMEELWDDIYDYQAFTRRAGLQSTWVTLEPEEVAFILDTIGTPWGSAIPNSHPAMKDQPHDPYS